MMAQERSRPRWRRKRWQFLSGLFALLLPPMLFLAMEGPVLFLGEAELYNAIYVPVWRTIIPVLPYDVQFAHFRYCHWWMDVANGGR